VTIFPDDAELTRRPARPVGGTPARRIFVGRAAQRSALAAARSTTGAGRRAVVFIDGPSGFGKTSLVADMLDASTPARVPASRAATPRVWRAASEPDEATTPYGVLGQLLRGHDGELSPKLAAIARGERIAADPLVVGVELLTLLDTPSAELVIFVDDVQWADPPSLRALVFALRRLADSPVLVVLTCRSDAAGSLPPSLERFLAQTAIRIDMVAFTAADVRELAIALGHRKLSQRTAQRIVEHAGGSPLHARAVLSEIADSDAAAHPEHPLPVPTDYARFIENRLAGCAAPARAFADAASVIAGARPLPLVAQLAALTDQRQALAAFDSAVIAGLFEPLGADRVVRIVHPLARAAIYQAIPATRRADLHRRAAMLLAPLDADAALRQRIAASDGIDEELAEQVGRRAASDLAAHAWSSAASWLRAARSLSPPPMDDHYLTLLVEAVVLDADAAAAASVRAQLELRPASAVREYLLARLSTLAGDLAGAARHAKLAWQLRQASEFARTSARPGDAQLRARIAAELARTSLTTGHAGEAIEWANRALASEPAEAVGPAASVERTEAAGVSPLVDMPGTILLATAVQGHFAQALAATAGLPGVISAPTPEQLDVMIARGMLSLWSGDLDQANADLTTAVRVTRRDGPAHLNLGASAYLADTAFRLGDWDTAISEAETAISLALDLDNVRALPMLHAAAATPYAYRGDFDTAAEHVGASLHTAEQVGDMQTALWSRVAAGRLAYARRHPAAVVAALEPLAARADLDGIREPGFQPWQCMYATALAILGRLGAAEQILDGAAVLARERGHVVQQLAIARAAAELLVRRNRIDDAWANLAAAKAHLSKVRGHPFEVAEFELTLGRLARRTGRRDAAVSLRRARDIFEDLRAAPWVDQAVAELNRCGPGQRSPSTLTWADLTAKEAAVVGLVAAGMTNREIATHLVVSPKTVEFHLSNIFVKLDVRSRTQLATWHATHAGRALPTY
jgi:ATP/maltotriose-dependent transcriptional regulator MalT